MADKKKKLAWIIPIAVAVILFLALWVNQIINERQLPAQGWSRTIHPSITSTLETPYVTKKSNSIHLFTLNNNGITHSILNDKLKLLKKDNVKINGDIQRVIWADSEQIIYKKDGNLYLWTDGKEKLIAKATGDAKVSSDGVLYYAQQNTIHTYKIATGAIELITTLKNPIENIAVDQDQLVVATQDDVSNWHFFYLSMSDTHPAPKEFTQFLGMSHGNMSVLEIAQHDGKLGMFFVTHILRQGEYFYDYYMEFPLAKMSSLTKPTTINETPMTFTVKNTGEYLQTIKNTHFYLVNNQPVFIFSSEGLRTLRDQSINIYEGYKNDKGQWVAERRSTSPEMSQFPFMIDKSTIGWIDYISDNKNQVGITSQNKAVIDQSMGFITQDFSHSLSNSVLSLSRVFMLFLLAIGYAIPTILIYAIISFTKVELIERDSQAIKWILLGIFFVSQFFLIGHTQTVAFQAFAPSYLNFTFNQWIIPTILALLTWLIVKWVKTDNWGIITEVFYFMTLLTIMELFIFGPYFF